LPTLLLLFWFLVILAQMRLGGVYTWVTRLSLRYRSARPSCLRQSSW